MTGTHILEPWGLKSIMEVLSLLKRGFIMISLTMLDCCRVVMAQSTSSVEYNVNLRCGIGKFKVFFSFKVSGTGKKMNYLGSLPVKNVFLFILISLFAPEMCKKKKPRRAVSVITNPKFIALFGHYYYTAQKKKALGSCRWHSNSPSSNL